MNTTTTNARQICEDILRAEIATNIAMKIHPKEIAIARRLLERGDEMAPVYEELYDKLRGRDKGLEVMLDLLIRVPAHWGPDKIQQARADRKTLGEVNEKIARHAEALADLLEHRDELHNQSGFAGDTLFHIVDVIEQASGDNYLFLWHLQENLDSLRGQYDLKYWPALAKCMRAIANDAATAEIQATDALIDVATTGKRPASRSDFVMALLEDIEECRGERFATLPPEFQPSDGTLATIVNVLLDLPPEDLVDAGYIKGRRRVHKERGR